MNYEEAVEFIENTPKFLPKGVRNKSGNDNLSRVMELLGNPQERIPAVHIAGTNGKGSTARFTMNILATMGYKVGIFTSPHLVRVNERIAVAYPASGSMDAAGTDTRSGPVISDITDEDFLECFNRVMEAVEKNVRQGGSYLSYFEMLFAMATVYFEDIMPDYVVYETGLGGRLDATNIITPVATAITSIGLDHTAYLGNTIEKIAREKAGIIKPGVPVVYNTGDEVADEVIENRAAILGSPSINVAKTGYIANEITDKTIDFSFATGYYKYHNIILKVAGAKYQMDNAATAIALCNCMFDKPVPENCVRKACSEFYWPGRMERIGRHIIADGAHNEDAVKRYIEAVKLIKKDEITMLFAVSADKDYEPMIKLLSQRLSLDNVIVTTLDTDRATDAAVVSGLFERYNKGNTVVYHNDCIKEALWQGYNMVKEKHDILFCVGSLYLVGSIKGIAMEGMDK